jgi:hypothetical protein
MHRVKKTINVFLNEKKNTQQLNNSRTFEKQKSCGTLENMEKKKEFILVVGLVTVIIPFLFVIHHYFCRDIIYSGY